MNNYPFYDQDAMRRCTGPSCSACNNMGMMPTMPMQPTLPIQTMQSMQPSMPPVFPSMPDFRESLIDRSDRRETNKRLLSPYEGFIRGNMFADTYEPYFSTEPYALKPANEREALLDKYRIYDFACTDLGLYLDNHPDDGEVIKLYAEYRSEADKWKQQYETQYGPLTMDGENINAYPWTWNMSPWSWEGV